MSRKDFETIVSLMDQYFSRFYCLISIRLISELERFIEQTDSENIPQFSELFPGCLQVCQAVEVWKKIVLHQDDIKKQK